MNEDRDRRFQAKLNIRLVETLLERLQQGDVDGVCDLVTEDFVIECGGSEKIPFAGTWKGKDGLREFLKVAMAAVTRVAPVEIEDIISEAETVMVTGFDYIADPQTGEKVKIWFHHTYYIKNRLVRRVKELFDTAVGETLINRDSLDQ